MSARRMANHGAALVRHYAVQILDVSSAGCLIESGVHLQTGLVGTLEVQLSGDSCMENFRVVRSHPGSSGGRWRIALEFLPVAPAGPASVRGALARIGSASIAKITLAP